MLNLLKYFKHDNDHESDIKPKPYSNPYFVGFGLGLVLLSAFIIMGRGLGASGAMSTLISVGLDQVAHEHVANNGYFSKYISDGTFNPLKDWLLFEVIGVLFGGFLSGALAGRIKLKTELGPRTTVKKRLLFAFIGGTLMGIGAKFARGCTSGQALSGGALLNFGSWAFMIMVFVGAYALAYFMRRQWT